MANFDAMNIPSGSVIRCYLWKYPGASEKSSAYAITSSRARERGVYYIRYIIYDDTETEYSDPDLCESLSVHADGIIEVCESLTLKVKALWDKIEAVRDSAKYELMEIVASGDLDFSDIFGKKPPPDSHFMSDWLFDKCGVFDSFWEDVKSIGTVNLILHHRSEMSELFAMQPD